MSGNTQPRRRKDKKKRKDEQIEETTVQPQPLPTPPIPNDDTNIHVHKEMSLGGGVCAKSVFFFLMIIISIIIGLTITDYHGQTDVEIPESESRFARIFEGWIEKSSDTHEDDEHEHVHSDEISHEDEENEDHDEDESQGSENEEEPASEEAEDEETEETEESQQEDEEEELEDDEDESEQEKEEEDEESQEIQEDEDEENQIESGEEEEDIPAEESEQEEQEVPQVSEEELQQDEDEDEEKDDVKSEENEDEEDEEETKEPDEKEDSKLKNDEEETDNVIEDENPETSATNMAAKVGVGISLFIVAYVVLVKKWKTDKPVKDDTIKDEQIPADLTRRNTFVPPPTLEEVEQDIENLEEEYSDEEETEESDEDRRSVPASKRQYEELRTTYHRSLTPDSDNDYRKKKYDDSEDEEEGENEEDDYGDREQYEEEIEEEEEDEEDDEDEELMKKLEARYGRLDGKAASKYAQEENDDEEGDDKHFRSWKRIKKSGSEVESDSENEDLAKISKSKSGAQKTYEFHNITNANDYVYRDDLDEAQKHLNNNIQLALSLFTKFLENHPDSPRALYGKAHALDLWAEKKRSNEILQESIQVYLQVLNAKDVPDALFLIAAERCINRMRFIGNYGRAIYVHKKLIERFPEEVKYKNDLAVTYLTTNRIPEARSLLIDILYKFPNDGFALVHYGFILKNVDNNLSKAIDYLRKGIQTKEPGVIDGRFYFHLGDALARLGKNNEAMKIYEDGVLNKVFLSKYQRSLYNVGRLTAKPWWNKEQTPYTNLYKQLEQNYQTIRKEGLAILNKRGYFKDESENLRDVGDWKQFELYARGMKHAENCKKAPLTCKIIDSEPDAKGCRRGQVKFSVMHPGTHVWPHCGPTNCRLRIHLGLKVPPRTYIRVAEETRTWEEGKIFIFDDSFEHEVWHNGTEFRLVLIIDVWHPELTKNEKHNLSAI